MSTTALVRTSTFLEALFGDSTGLLELRLKEPEGRIQQHFVALHDLDTIKQIVRVSNAVNVWFGVAPRTIEDGSINGCGPLTTLFADLDFKDSSEDTIRTALDVWRLPPSILVNSGGGLHPYYLLREPLDLPSDKNRAKSLLRRLAQGLGGDSAAAEPARVLRLPNTQNVKYDPPRPVSLEIFDPDRRYNLSEIEDWLPEESRPSPLTAVNGTIPKGHRHRTMVSNAGALRRRGLDEPAIRAALEIDNTTRFKPPLPLEEVTRIAHDIAQKPPAEGPRQAEPASPLESITLTEMLGKPPEEHRWLVHDRLAVDSVNLLLGRPKSGKSTLARWLALAVASGTPWLGFSARRGDVFYVALEDKESEVTRHFRQMGAEGHEDIEFFFGRAPADILERLRTRLDLRHVDLVIVDTVQRLLGVKDSNDYAEVSKAFDPVIEIARTHHVCLVLLHHAGKMNRGSASDNSLGSTAYASSVDNVIELVKADRFHYLHSDQRIGTNLEPTVLTLDPQTGRVETGGKKTDYERQLAADAMVDAIMAAGVEGIERPDLLEAVEMRRDLKIVTLKWLIKAGQVRREGKGTKGNPHRFWVTRLQGTSGTRNREALPLETAPATPATFDSGSRGSLKSWEPESSSSSSGTFRPETTKNSGSRMCTGIDPPREPEKNPREPEFPPDGSEDPDAS